MFEKIILGYDNNTAPPTNGIGIKDNNCYEFNYNLHKGEITNKFQILDAQSLFNGTSKRIIIIDKDAPQKDKLGIKEDSIKENVDGKGIDSKSITITDNSIQNRYVDLSLPSGNLGATCNLGAGNPEEYGNYYSWPYSDGSKYNSEDNKTVLDIEDDIAHNVLGGNGKMPTNEDFIELVNNTNGIWTTKNEINGYLFTSKIDSNKSIFLPASGNRFNSNGAISNLGSNGYYWSSSPSSVTGGFSLSFYSGSVNQSRSGRTLCCSIRPLINPN